MKKYVMWILFLFVVTLTSGCGSKEVFIKETNSAISSIEKQQNKKAEDDFNKYLKIEEIEIINNLEKEITKTDLVKLKIKNISDKIIYGMVIFLDYVNKEGISFAEATMIAERIKMRPGYIKIVQAPLGVFTDPKDIVGEWNQKLNPEIVDIIFNPNDDLNMNRN